MKKLALAFVLAAFGSAAIADDWGFNVSFGYRDYDRDYVVYRDCPPRVVYYEDCYRPPMVVYSRPCVRTYEYRSYSPRYYRPYDRCYSGGGRVRVYRR